MRCPFPVVQYWCRVLSLKFGGKSKKLAVIYHQHHSFFAYIYGHFETKYDRICLKMLQNISCCCFCCWVWRWGDSIKLIDNRYKTQHAFPRLFAKPNSIFLCVFTFWYLRRPKIRRRLKRPNIYYIFETQGQTQQITKIPKLSRLPKLVINYLYTAEPLAQIYRFMPIYIQGVF